jgi:hypothetical protein
MAVIGLFEEQHFAETTIRPRTILKSLLADLWNLWMSLKSLCPMIGPRAFPPTKYRLAGPNVRRRDAENRQSTSKLQSRTPNKGDHHSIEFW